MGKNSVVRLLVMIVIVFLVFGTGVWADQEINLEVHQGSVIQSVYVSAITGDTTYLPVRQMSELINVPLNWDGDMGSVIWHTYRQTTVITPGIDTVYMVNETLSIKKTEVKSFMNQGKVYIPIRTIELLGIRVDYNDKTTQRSLYIPDNINWASEPISQEKFNLVRDLIIKEKEQIPQKMGSFITYFNPADKSRTQNLKLAAAAINDIQVEAGKTFSFNETVGPRSPERGYKEATIFVNKQKVEGYGGGVCQVSTTLYNAVQNAGLLIVERHPHSLPVPYVPLGKDATVNYGTKDFKFKNDKERAITIKATVDNNKLTVEIYFFPGLPE
ncbi:MAG: VanW family protein [Dehalobacterium sp.]